MTYYIKLNCVLALSPPVRAGMPEAAINAPADMVSLDSLLVNKPSTTFFTPIKGDSMIDVRLMDGDTAVCERRHLTNVGDIVVALFTNEVTIKTLIKERDRYVLKPENKAKDYPTVSSPTGGKW